jgi:hypothetical protein
MQSGKKKRRDVPRIPTGAGDETVGPIISPMHTNGGLFVSSFLERFLGRSDPLSIPVSDYKVAGWLGDGGQVVDRGYGDLDRPNVDIN